FCEVAGEGIQSQNDYKRVVEMVIYFDDFVFQVLVLDLLHKLELNEIAGNFAKEIKQNPEYSFVYFDKYFPHLKKFFVKERKETPSNEAQKDLHVDLTLEDKYISPIVSSEINSE